MSQTIASTTSAAAKAPKGKTKAKKRYLKAKKERRKKRKTLSKSGSAVGTKATSQSEQHALDESESSASESEGDDASEAEVHVPESTPAKQTQKQEPRPNKRRKLDTADAGDISRSPSPQRPTTLSPQPTTSKESPATAKPRSPTPPAALPAFPQPRRPDAPSKTVLALQGLDKALIEAEVVDPSTTLPLPLTTHDAQDERTGLSGRMCRRLSDLGIAELFAVQTAVVPLLLASSRARSLYRPYDPPGDLLQGGSSRVDILICTPGRLIDHLHGTPNFSLQHLRFLVIDEADRLLTQSFQDWLAQVLAATRPPKAADDHRPSESSVEAPAFSRPHPDALAPAFIHLLRSVPYVRTDFDEKKEPSCQKLLFSATLTRDPAKIAALGLRNPKYIVVQRQKEGVASKEEGVLDFVMEKFTMPSTLTEHMLVCDTAVKPLMLFYLVHTRGVTNALVFTKSAESTTRLVRLFEFFEVALHDADNAGSRIVARAYSSDLAPAERKSILEQFKNQEINILICSDLISRGIDISHVSHVVSYDVPVDFRKYVHRVGRTARAGRAGDAWTLVEEQEARYFKSMLKEADHLDKVKRLRVSDTDVAPLKPAYEAALARLKEVYARGG
ncbi:hypothetical protein BN946_scf184835.g3 [Trametes cinnabarina]|uniref:ATP-dependent RNA helicase n=1 Tax=Pycnoporus cinnabarinus TaxID=5643 RepID=A0A060STD4_PYCCI|nr:hypothetical protein BN946_scf184835.g3 [Trametes cinnabarina]